MVHHDHGKPGVYVSFRDRLKRKKGECVTVEGCTPKQAKTLFLRFLRQQGNQRKAG